jgi:hypothetical protein
MWPFRSKAKAHPLALPIFRSLENQRGLLDEPVDVDQGIHQSCEPKELFAWGIFNPYGPTLSILSLLNHDDSDASLVHNRMLNPFSRTSEVVAVVEKGITQEALTEFLADAFAQNEIGESCLVGGLPSFLLFGKTQDTVELCLNCFQSHVAENDRMSEILDGLETYRKYPGNPWDRATGDQKHALRRFVAEKAGDSLPADSNASSEFDADLFVAWAEYILTDEHRLPEMQGFFQAWEGSIGFQKGNALAQSALNTRDLLTLLSESCPSMVLQLAEAIRPGKR